MCRYRSILPRSAFDASPESLSDNREVLAAGLFQAQVLGKDSLSAFRGEPVGKGDRDNLGADEKLRMEGETFA